MGPSPMALGPFAFEALGFSFQEQGRQLETPWAELNVADRFDVLQWTGPKSDAFTIKGVLFTVEFGGQASLDGLRAAATAGQALMLVTGAGGVYGRHVVMSVSEERSYIDASGAARRNGYDISLRRYHGGGGFGGIVGAAVGLVGLY